MFSRFVALTIVILLVIVLLFSSCGEIVEQNKIVLTFKMLGQRTAEVTNLPEEAQTELTTATRLKLIRAGVKYVVFPRGNQTYRFTKLASIESKENEEFTINAVDGNISFDVIAQLHIKTDSADLKDRLVRFCQDYSLLRYAGNPNALGLFINERMRPELQNSFQTYMADKKVLSLTRSKGEINQYVTGYMNKKFNPYGLEFTLVGLGSAFTFDVEQQNRMNDIVNQEVESRIVQIHTAQILPLDKEISRITLEGERETAKIINEATAIAIQIKAKAWEGRRKLIINEIGEDNYVEYERVKSLTTALQGSETKIKLLPNNTAVLLGQ